MRASEPEAAVALMLAYWWWWQNLGLVDEQLDRLDAALGAADPARMPLDVLSAALYQASTRATYLGRIDEAAAFADQLAELRDQHPEKLVVRADWAFALATLTWYRAGGDRLQGNRLMREAQDAAEARGSPYRRRYAAGNIALAAILWDAVDDPDVARAIGDSTRLAQRAGFPNMAVLMRVFDGVIRVMGGGQRRLPVVPRRLRRAGRPRRADGWPNGAGCVSGVAAELVGDHPAAAAHALRFVRFCRRSGVRIMLTCGIRGAARLSATAGYPDAVAATVGRRRAHRGRHRHALHAAHGTTGPPPAPAVRRCPRTRRHPPAGRRSILVGRRDDPSSRRSTPQTPRALRPAMTERHACCRAGERASQAVIHHCIAPQTDPVADGAATSAVG